MLVVGHTENSHRFIQEGSGEIGFCKKLWNLCHDLEMNPPALVDVFELFGKEEGKDRLDKVSKLYFLNEQLELLGYDQLDECDETIRQQVLEELKQKMSKDNPLLLLSWTWQVAALFRVGVRSLGPFIAKCYTPLDGFVVDSACLNRCDLLVTECLYANQVGVCCGIPPWKMLYLPHYYPQEADRLFALSEETVKQMQRDYLGKLADKMGKKRPSMDKAVVVGVVSRLKQGKNIEEAIEAFEKVVRQCPEAVFVLKSGPACSIMGHRDYQLRLSSFLKEAYDKPWFFWDQELTPFPEVLQIFRLFDCCMLLSGVEGASNAAVELAGLGRPCLLLKESTNPCLFEGGFTLIPDAGVSEPGYPYPVTYRRPDEGQLVYHLLELVRSKGKREEMSQKARKMAVERFAKEHAMKKLVLMREAAVSYYKGCPKQEHYKRVLEEQYVDDLARYQIMG